MASPDLRPVIQDGLHFAAELVTPQNIHGYNDANGNDLSRRLDKPESVAAWKDILERAAKADVQGLLWWQPGGYYPDRPQYLIDSHLVPPDVLPQFIAINKIAKANGLWVGSLLRPAELATRYDWIKEGGFAFDEMTADVKRFLGIRVNSMWEYGAGDAFYLDSYGFGECDAEIAKWLRSVVGPKVPLFTEAWSDRLGPYTGAYAYSADGKTWLNYGPQFDILRWMFPDQPCVAVDATWRPWDERIAWGKAAGVAPMFLNFEVPAMPTSRYDLGEEKWQIGDLLRRHLTRHEKEGGR